MKNVLLGIVMLVFGINVFSQQTSNHQEVTASTKVMVYFFHGTHRCAGCVNAEKATVSALNMLYKEQLANGIIVFQSINVEEEKNKALAEKYEAAWNKLLFVKASDTKQQVELTEQAFSYSNNADKLAQVIKPNVEKLLK